MKILQVSFHTAPFTDLGNNDSGGMSLYIEEITKLISNSNQVHVLTGEKREDFQKTNLIFKSFNLFDASESMDAKEGYLDHFIKNLTTYVDKEKFDVIHAHYWLSGLAAKSISQQFKIPFVFTAHSLGVFRPGYNKERTDCEKIIMNSANIVSASSEYEKELIINSYGIDNLKIKYVSPGVNQEMFSIDNEIKRENIFLSIGRVQSQKGQMETIKFLNSFRKVENDFKCFFIGGPSGSSGEEYFKELTDMINSCNLEDNVEFIGSLSQQSICTYLNKAKLLIHTSQFETFGLVALEANAMGVPVLTTNLGSLKEIVEHKKNGFIAEDIKNIDSINFVKQLIQDENFFTDFSKRSIRKASNFSWENTAAKFVDEYVSIS